MIPTNFAMPAHSRVFQEDVDQHADDLETTLDTREEVSPSQTAQLTTSPMQSRQQRHSKRLSLNFPILVPANLARTAPFTSSPTCHPAAQTSSSSSYFSPRVSHQHNASVPSNTFLPVPPTPGSEVSEEILHSPLRSPVRTANIRKAHGRSQSMVPHTTDATIPPDFLTLLASQERRVLELKEELHRAEMELSALKKSWAVHEAGRKKGELKTGVVRLTPIPKSSVASPVRASTERSESTSLASVGLGLNIDDENAKETRKKDNIRDKLTKNGSLESVSEIPGEVGKKSGRRVFSGSRHTRALSLLSTSNLNSVNGRKHSLGDLKEQRVSMDTDTQVGPLLESTPRISPATTVSESDTQLLSAPPLLRSTTTSSLGSMKDSPSLNFGKTYKDLASAASRRSIPQSLQVVNGSAEVLVKQGKIVVDGVRDGLWNFFEDMRQATVGEEAVREINSASNSHGNQSTSSKARSKSTEKETSFWREFGIETPKGDKLKKGPGKETTPVCSKHPHGHARHSNTKSQLARSEQLADKAEKSLSSAVIESPKPTPIVSESTSKPALEQSEPVTKPREHEHESKSSTDSGDSRNPPSLLDDSILEEEENWEWGSVESPVSSRFSGLLKAREKTSGERETHWHELMS